jgi:hypothetical protein
MLEVVINKDPATPSMLNHLLSSDLIKDSWFACVDPNIKARGFDSEFIHDFINLITSIIICPKGLEMIVSINPFPFIFDCFHNYSHTTNFDSEILISNTPRLIAKKLNELLRKCPELTPYCMDAFVHEIDEICNLHSIINNSNSNNVNLNTSCSEEVSIKIIYTNALLIFAERFIHSESLVKLFLSKSGLDKLIELYNASRSSVHYLLSSGIDGSLELRFSYQFNLFLGVFENISKLDHIAFNSLIVKEILRLYNELIKKMNHFKIKFSVIELSSNIKKASSSSELQFDNILNIFGNECITDFIDQTSEQFLLYSDILLTIRLMSEYIEFYLALFEMLTYYKKDANHHLLLDNTNKLIHQCINILVFYTSSCLANLNYSVTEQDPPKLIYRLHATHNKPLHVYSQPNLSSSKVHRIHPHTILDAYERVFIKSKKHSNTKLSYLFYRIDSGWICSTNDELYTNLG